MAKRLKFKQFKDSLEKCELPMGSLASYVQFDPKSPIPKLMFRHDALVDKTDDGYNLDREIYKYSRKMREMRRVQVATFQRSGRKSVVAEGDSWFHLPDYSIFGFRLFPFAIADWMERNRRYDVRNISHWGHTLKEIIEAKEYISVMKEKTPDFFILSAGGNDLQLGLANQEDCYIYEYDEMRESDNYISPAGKKGIADIEEGYKEILDEVTEEFPNLKVFCHGYDYPRPLVGDGEHKGQFIGRYLDFWGIPEDEMDAILKPIVDALNTAIQRAVESCSHASAVEYINLRGETEEYTWMDDMHPDEDGFAALALKFEEAMSR